MILSVQNWSLGSTRHHVLDAISLCEQEERRQGQDEKGAQWHLSFKKELFTPWHDCTVDPISTELIYTQIIHDLKSGEYHCDKVIIHTGSLIINKLKYTCDSPEKGDLFNPFNPTL